MEFVSIQRIPDQRTDGTSLLDMTKQVIGLVQNKPQEPGCFLFHKLIEPGYLLCAPDERMHQTTEGPEQVAVTGQRQSLIPPNHLARHDKWRTIGVDGASLVEEVYCSLNRIEDDGTLAEDCEREDVT